jgi:hypothetical protein
VWVDLVFTGMNPGKRYTLVVTGNRGANGTRPARFTISDADSFTNSSSTGAVFSGQADSSVVFETGINTSNGYVARFSEIDAGADGGITVRVQPLLSGEVWSGGTSDGRAFLNQLKLIEVAGPGGSGPQLQAAVSRRTHGGAGPFDLSMTLGSSATDIEPRVGTAGVTPQSVLTFDSAIEATDGSADCGQEVVVSNGTCNSVSISGSTMTVNMTFGKNQCVAVALSGIRGAGAGPAMTGTSAVSVLTHEGNVNADDNVNLLDLNDIKLTLFQAVGAGNFKNDINADASINLLDLNATKINLFVAKPTCP